MRLSRDPMEQDYLGGVWFGEALRGKRTFNRSGSMTGAQRRGARTASAFASFVGKKSLLGVGGIGVAKNGQLHTWRSTFPRLVFSR